MRFVVEMAGTAVTSRASATSLSPRTGRDTVCCSDRRRASVWVDVTSCRSTNANPLPTRRLALRLSGVANVASPRFSDAPEMRAQNAPTVPAILPARARRCGCFGGNADAIRPTPSTTGAVCANPSMTACPGSRFPGQSTARSRWPTQSDPVIAGGLAQDDAPSRRGNLGRSGSRSKRTCTSRSAVGGCSAEECPVVGWAIA